MLVMTELSRDLGAVVKSSVLEFDAFVLFKGFL